MPEFDAATGNILVPIWTAGAASAILVVAVVLAIARAGAAAAIQALFRVTVVAVAIYGGWLYLQSAARQEHAVARRALDERSATLARSAVAPGSALACLDEMAGERVEIACEKAVFASPEAVAAAVAYVTAQLTLLADGSAYAGQMDAAYAAQLEPLRGALELDRFGLVAHVLAGRDGCTAEDCAATARFHDRSKVIANLRDRTFDEQLGKYAARWNAPAAAAAEPATSTAMAPGALPRSLGPAPATVSPRYDFPSSRSIPAINIMAAEPRVVAAPNPQAAGAPASATPPAPVQPRRPPQSRPPATSTAAAPSRPPPPQPVTATGAPADGGGPPPAVPLQPR